MLKDTMTVEELRNALGITEEQGYDAPFLTFTWERWQEMQTQMLQGFLYFQRAVSQKRSLAATLIALEIQQMATDMLKEACCLIDGKPSKN